MIKSYFLTYDFAGCLNAQTGKVTYVSGVKKNSDLFITLLKEMNFQYRRAESITLIFDNDGIYKNRKVRVWLKQNVNQITYLIVIMY